MRINFTVKIMTVFFLLVSNYLLLTIPTNALIEENTAQDPHPTESTYITPEDRYQSDYKDTIIEGSKIIRYDSFAARDFALLQIPSDKVVYKFHAIPMLTVKDLDQIPSTGLTQVINDRYVVQKAEYPDVDDYYDGNSLNKTMQKIFIEKLQTEYGLTGDGQSIAIIDSGVMTNLEAFKDSSGNSRVTSYNVSGVVADNPPEIDHHGTHVSGIAAGNGKYIIDGKWQMTDSPGMAPKADIISIRVLDETGFGPNSWLLEGLDYAIYNTTARVISLSLSTSLYYGEEDVFKLIADKAFEEGKILVAAAGNRGPTGSGVGIPGGIDSVIGVGAAYMKSNKINGIWQFSAIGPGDNDFSGPDLVAPGNDILSLNAYTGRALTSSGTSMATPHISGGILLLLEAFPDATPAEIRAALLASAMDMDEPSELQGRGLANFTRAIDILNDIKENNQTYVVSMPGRIIDQNYYYHHRLSGVTKSIPIFLYSHINTTVYPKTNYLDGSSFDLPASLFLTEGLNKILLNLTVTASDIALHNGFIVFDADENGKPMFSADIQHAFVTRFPTAKILFDTAHDLDTPSKYFAHHGPKGQFSEYSRILEEQGFVVEEHKQGNITSSILDDYDVLIIADPDDNVTYSAAEIDAINSFVVNDGKALLIMANGGFQTAEHLLYDDFNLEDINAMLDGTGIFIGSEEPILACNEDWGYDTRRIECPSVASTGTSQTIFKSGLNFPFYGPALNTTQINGVSVQEVAFDSDENPIIVASELPSKGRVMVFSSTILFDNLGLLDNYISQGSTKINKEISIQTIDWLVAPRMINVEYTVNDIEVDEIASITMYDEMTIDMYITTPDGDPIDKGASIWVNVLQDDDLNLIHELLEFVEVADGHYQRVHIFESYGYYDFYFHVLEGDYIPADGHQQMVVNLKYMEYKDAIQNIAQILLLLTFMSWLVWIKNEGGFTRKNEMKKKDMDN
ncbi:MAG: S8 family serine peptidase [Candidatus Heimdallarchaeota archaeon]|nr:S8 family serine peptidase [Candidatus Heimdallarchaeota archaeon]